jgi:hypothetical protein
MHISKRITLYYLYTYGSTVPVDLGRFFSFLIYTQTVGLLGRGSARRKAATYTQNNTNSEKTPIDIHALSGIRTFERVKTVNALDRAANLMDNSSVLI